MVVGMLLVALATAMSADARTRRPAAACDPLSEGRELTLVSASGVVDRRFPDAQGGDPQAIVADGRGGWFVGGGFVCIGGVHTRGLVRLRANGRLDGSWIPALPANGQYVDGYEPPSAMVLSGGTLFVGGLFGVEALNAKTGEREWLAPDKPGLQGVFALAASPDAIYVGGDFSKLDGQGRAYLAAIDPADGHLLSWQGALLGGATDSTPPYGVDAVALDGTTLFIGGRFSTVGGRPRPGFAALNTVTGAVTPWTPGTARGLRNGSGVGDVETIVEAAGELMSAGHDGFGVTSAATGAIEPWMNTLSGVGYRFATYGHLAYVAGNCRNGFDAVGGKRRNNLAAFNLVTNTVTSWAPMLAKYVCVSAIGADKNDVLVAGDAVASLG